MKLSSILYALGFISIAVSAANYLTGKVADESGAERNGLFVGEWPPTFFILGKIVEDRERAKEL